MIGTRWRKVVRELWLNRPRTVLVIVSIAVGIFAVGAVQLLRSVIVTELQGDLRSQQRQPGDPFRRRGRSRIWSTSIRRMPEIADAQGRSNLVAKVQVAPDEWKNISLIAVEDFTDIRISRIQPDEALHGAPGAAPTALARGKRNRAGAQRAEVP